MATINKNLIATANDKLIYIKTRIGDVLFYNYTDREADESEILKEFNKNLKEFDWNIVEGFNELGISLETKESTMKTISKALSIVNDYLLSLNWDKEGETQKQMEILENQTNDDEFNAWVVLTVNYIRAVYDLYYQDEKFQNFIKEATR
ncbi:hypothetical protein ACX1NB_01180 [Mycoplasma sp. HF14]